MIACGTAAPSLQHNPSQYAYAGPVASYASAAPVLVQEIQHVPAVAKVAEYVEHVPTSVSHHGSAVVHNTAAIATPTITEVHRAAPIVEEVHEAQFVAAPVLKAAPILKQEIVEIQPEIQYTSGLAKVGEIVEHVPSSVSHHSSSVVHSTAAVATPVITPVAKTVVATAPVYKASIAAPVIAPVAKTVVAPAPIYKAAPILKQEIVEIRPEVHHVPAVTKVGEIVEHVPTSVSHHSSSVVHNTAAVATPVITPVAKTVVATAPVYKAAPLLKTVHAPATYAVQAPLYESAPYAAYQDGATFYHGEPLLRTW